MFEGQIFEKINTNDKKILPILFPPPIKYSLLGAIRLSIILTHKGTEDWFYSNFMQLIFYETAKTDDTKEHMIQFLSQMDSSYRLFLDTAIITDEIMQIDDNNIISYIINWINNGYYVDLKVDVSLLPNTRYFNKGFIIHSTNIFGYDLSNKIFKVIDFDNKGNLSIIDIKFDDFTKAFSSDKAKKKIAVSSYTKNAKKFYIKLSKFNEKTVLNNESIFPLNINFIVDQLKDYYYSKNTSFRYKPVFKKEYNVHFGISIHEAIIEYLKRKSANNEAIDIRAFHAIWEHKRIMSARIKYFNEKNILNKTNLSEEFIAIENDAYMARMFSFKYNVKKDKNIINEIILIFEKINKLEKESLNKLINELA